MMEQQSDGSKYFKVRVGGSNGPKIDWDNSVLDFLAVRKVKSTATNKKNNLPSVSTFDSTVNQGGSKNLVNDSTNKENIQKNVKKQVKKSGKVASAPIKKPLRPVVNNKQPTAVTSDNSSRRRRSNRAQAKNLPQYMGSDTGTSDDDVDMPLQANVIPTLARSTSHLVPSPSQREIDTRTRQVRRSQYESELLANSKRMASQEEEMASGHIHDESAMSMSDNEGKSNTNCALDTSDDNRLSTQDNQICFDNYYSAICQKYPDVNEQVLFAKSSQKWHELDDDTKMQFYPSPDDEDSDN